MLKLMNNIQAATTPFDFSRGVFFSIGDFSWEGRGTLPKRSYNPGHIRSFNVKKNHIGKVQTHRKIDDFLLLKSFYKPHISNYHAFQKKFVYDLILYIL